MINEYCNIFIDIVWSIVTWTECHAKMDWLIADHGFNDYKMIYFWTKAQCNLQQLALQHISIWHTSVKTLIMEEYFVRKLFASLASSRRQHFVKMLCEQIPGDQQFLKYLNQPFWNQHACHACDRDHILSSFWCSMWVLAEALDLYTHNFMHCAAVTWLADYITTSMWSCTVVSNKVDSECIHFIHIHTCGCLSEEKSRTKQ